MIFFHSKKDLYILLTGFAVGIGTGYFGIGGFTIVPALIHPISGITDAVGISLLPVSAFVFLTAARHSLSGEINLFISLLFIAVGMLGGLCGTRISFKVLKKNLGPLFARILVVVDLNNIEEFIKYVNHLEIHLLCVGYYT